MIRIMLLATVLVILMPSIGMGQQTHGATLNWTQSVDQTLAGDCIYTGTASGGPYTKVACTPSPVTNYFIPLTAQNSGIQTFFVVTALDKDGIESVYSNEKSGTFPVLPQPDTALSVTTQ